MLLLLLQVAPPAVDLAGWMGGAETNLMAGINSAGPFVFRIMSVIVGIALVMKLTRMVLK